MGESKTDVKLKTDSEDATVADKAFVGEERACRREFDDNTCGGVDDESESVQDLASTAKGVVFVSVDAGRLAASAAPGPGAVKSWKECGASTVVTLLRDDEPAFNCAKDQIIALGLRWLHLPLSGKKAITEPQQARAGKATKTKHDALSLSRVHEVTELLKAGESVVVHCAAGMHRTGVVCYLTLRRLNLSPKDALSIILKSRPITHEEITKSTSNHLPLCELAEGMMPTDMRRMQEVQQVVVVESTKPKVTEKSAKAAEKAAKKLAKQASAKADAQPKRLTKRQQRIQAEFGDSIT